MGFYLSGQETEIGTMKMLCMQRAFVKFIHVPSSIDLLWSPLMGRYFFFNPFDFRWHSMWDLPQPGIEPTPPTVEAQSLNHGTSREVPQRGIVICQLTDEANEAQRR